MLVAYTTEVNKRTSWVEGSCLLGGRLVKLEIEDVINFCSLRGMRRETSSDHHLVVT